MTIPLAPTMQVLAALNCQAGDAAEQERLDAQCEGEMTAIMDCVNFDVVCSAADEAWSRDLEAWRRA
jgi:hypothetical protein